MKKNIKIYVGIVFMAILLILLLQSTSYAASFNASISKTSATVGDTIKLTLTADNAAGMYNVSISGSAVTLASGSSSEWIENQSLELELKASKAGTSNIVVTSATMADLDDSDNKINVTKTFTVTVKEKTTSSSSGSNNSGTSSSGSSNSSSNTSTTKTPTFKSANKTVYTTGTVNLRSSWSTNSSATTVPKGTALTLTGTSSETINGYTWYRVSYNGTTKYVASSLVTSTKPAEEESDINTLSSLGIEGIELTPSFEEDVTQYTAHLPEDVTKLEITAKATDSKATVDIEGNEELKDGDNTITITVTAEDGSTKEYTIHAVKGESEATIDNAILKLSNLEIAGVDFAGIFSPDTYSYELNLNISVKNLNITATPNQEDATIEIIGNENFVEGENMVTILVTSADGSKTATYQIKVVMPSEAIENKNDIQFYLICGGIVIAAVVVIIVIIVIVKRRNRSIENEFKDEANDENVMEEEKVSDKDNITSKRKKATIDEFLDTSELEEKPKRSRGKHSE